MDNLDNNNSNKSQDDIKENKISKIKDKKFIITFILAILVILAGFFVYVYNKKSNNIAPVITEDQADANDLAKYFSNDALKQEADVLPPDEIRQRFEDALEAYRQEIADEEAKEDGNPYSGYLGVANTYRQLGDFSQALAAYKTAIEKYPNDFLVWHNLGVLYEDMHQYLEAAKAYRKSIANKPVEQLAYLKLTDLYVKYSNDKSRAKDVYIEALDATKNNIQVLKFYAAYLEDVLKENQSAVAIWQKVLELEPDNQDVKSRISDLENE